MKKILFCFLQVGGVNALLSVLEQWQTKYEMTVTGRQVVCDHLKKRNIPVFYYEELKLSENKGETSWFEHLSPDIVITDTIDLNRTNDGIICRDFWFLAQKYGIPSIAYVDCWWGYDIRFSLLEENTPPILPEFIAVIDELAKTDIINAGFAPEKIITLGSPRFEHLSNISIQSVKDEEYFSILFISQPLEKIFGFHERFGFTEKTTLMSILEILERFPQHIHKKLRLFVLLHPEEDGRELKLIVKKLNYIEVIFKKYGNPIDLVLAADLVLGMFSILLAEAAILKRPVLSIQLNMSQPEILITNVIGATLSIHTKEQLAKELYLSIINTEHRMTLLEHQNKFEVISNSSELWNKFVRKCCQQ